MYALLIILRSTDVEHSCDEKVLEEIDEKIFRRLS